VIDDAQYIMSFQYMRRIKENGWDKWNDIQGDFFNIIKACDYMPNDVIVYFLSHIQRDDEGHEKIKTMGKMLDEKITIEGLFTTVLKTAVKDGQYFFLTQNSGMDTVKSPIGMFPSYAIDNDLKYVDDKIRNYYEIGEFKADEEIAELDEEVKAEEIQKPDADGRKRRRKTVEAPTEKVDAPTDTPTETPAEQPKKRGRKPRNTALVETFVEEEKEQEAAKKPILTDAEIDKAIEDGDFKSLADATPAESPASVEAEQQMQEAPVRKRRRRSAATTDAGGLDLNDQKETF
jgi:hypothetical protein